MLRLHRLFAHRPVVSRHVAPSGLTVTFAALAAAPAVVLAMTLAVAVTTTTSAASAGPAAVAGDAALAARIAENRAWLRSLPSAPEPTLHRSGLRATELGRWPVRGANQGVAVDAEHFYGIGNFVVTKHRKATGEQVAEWIGLRGGPIIHFNGGHVVDGGLILAHSNFPQLPMASSIEVYDTTTLAPVASTSLGIRLGSLTWAERRDGVWWACFANYNDAGTTPGFDQRWTHVGRFNDDWQLLDSWLFPPQVVATWGKSSCSGGSWGPDGLLYVTGHDAAELYVLRIPRSGVTLDYVTTIDVPFEGQSWAWDRSAEPERIIFGISRQRHEVISARIPPVIEREPVR
jgi:hypothetical protein